MVKKQTTKAIVNRRVRHDYAIEQTYEAGIVLSGAEVKSLRSGHGHLRGAYVTIKDNELWLVNATITATVTNKNSLSEDDKTRARKLLIKAKERQELISAKEQGLSIVPLKILNRKRFIKVEIATAKGLKKYDKRERIKERDTQRDLNRTINHQ
jgi:SsrA-binding protein